MAKTRPPYTPEFRGQMVELVRAGRSPEDRSRNYDERRSGRMVPERPRQRQELAQDSVRRIYPLLNQEDDRRFVPRLSSVRHDRFRDGYGRQGSPDRDAASDLVGNAGSAADAAVSNRVAQVREQPRRRAAAPDGSLSARGSVGSSRRSLHQILHDVNGETCVFTLRGQKLVGPSAGPIADRGCVPRRHM
jgi:hypothetical protein